MFENIQSLQFTNASGFFKNEKLTIFPKILNILYGSNGSGKSSIAKAISKYVQNSIEGTPTETPEISLDGEISNDAKKNIFVFNEDYIERNIKLHHDGLQPIVMLGEQVELDEQIRIKREELVEIENRELSVDAEINDLKNDKKPDSIPALKKIITKYLKELWAERDRVIRDRRQNTAVNDELIEELYAIDKKTYNLSEIKKNVDNDVITLQMTKNTAQISWTTPIIRLPIDIDNLNQFLSKKIENPQLTERDEKIINIIKGTYGIYFQKSIEVFKDNNIDTCPMCLRSISKSEKENIYRIVKLVMNDEAKRYKSNVETLLKSFADPQISLPNLDKKMYGEDLLNAEKAIKHLNSALKKIRDLLQQRLENIYAEFNAKTDSNDIQISLDDLNKHLKIVEDDVKKHNQDITNTNVIRERAIKNNKIWASLELDDRLNHYKRACQLLESKKEEKLACETNKSQINSKINELQQQKNNEHIALTFINQALAYIYFDKKRMILQKGFGCYKLLSRNKDVAPQNVSIGERNVIALCYFFASIFSGRTENDKYRIPSLIIIDDPVSSFDYDNRVGVVSFLKWMINNFYKGCASTKFLIMTHDLSTLFDLQKIEDEICNNSGSYFELVNKTICPQGSPKNEYKDILEFIFNFAKNGQDKYSSFIGNQMRRLLEAYSTFLYEKNFTAIFNDDDILKSIPESKRPYYQNLMSRLILNGESHKQEDARTLRILDFKFTKDEKTSIAKSVISLLYYINPLHIKSLLKDNACREIEEWQATNFDILSDEAPTPATH